MLQPGSFRPALGICACALTDGPRPSPLLSPAVVEAAADPLSAYLEYYTALANASEQAGLGLCVTFYATTDSSSAPKTLLTRVHTGTD